MALPDIPMDGLTVNSGGYIVAPRELAGRRLVAVEATPCLEPAGPVGTCGFVRNHLGGHMPCSAAVIDAGPWAVEKLSRR